MQVLAIKVLICKGVNTKMKIRDKTKTGLNDNLMFAFFFCSITEKTENKVYKRTSVCITLHGKFKMAFTAKATMQPEIPSKTFFSSIFSLLKILPRGNIKAEHKSHKKTPNPRNPISARVWR
jgi:hypothetical protein